MGQARWCSRYLGVWLALLMLLGGSPEAPADDQGAEGIPGAPSFQAWSSPDSSNAERRTLTPLTSARHPWRLCAILPNLRDAYWLLVRYGLEQQAARIGVELTLIEASGYDAIEQQVSLIHKRCIEGEQDALLLAAVDHSALNTAVRSAHRANLPVIDLINGISATEVSAQIAVDYGELAYRLGRYMVAHARGQKLVLAPGPEGSAWARSAADGFRRALAGSPLVPVEIYFAAPFVRDQRRELAAIAARQPLELVAGTAVTAEAAVSLEDATGHPLEIYSYYYNPNLHRLIRCGRVRAAVYEFPAQQGRVAIDQAVRILERKPADFRLAVEPVLLTAKNVDQLLTPEHLPAALIEKLAGQPCPSSGD